MSEWWADLLSYRPSDFLMFSPRIYWRLFESINRAFWPAQVVVTLLGLGWLARRGLPRAALAVLGALWLLVAWAFLHERFAPIHWPARWFAAAFALEALLLVGAAAFARPRPAGRSRRAVVGLGLLAWSLLVHLALAGLSGRDWRQAEFVGLAPDPTAIATLGVLLLIEPVSRTARAAWSLAAAVPLLWCAASAATLATMGSWQALVPLAAVGVAVAGLRSG